MCKYLCSLMVIAILLGCSTAPKAPEVPFEDAYSAWSSYEDVGNWLKRNLTFSFARQGEIKKYGLEVYSPENLYVKRKGYCADAAYFAVKMLNRVNPEYRADLVFIENAGGRTPHWVAAFYVESKLYIMDYGAGPGWKAMNGIHGPYDSLNEYRKFLSYLSLPKFRVGNVYFRIFPGTVN